MMINLIKKNVDEFFSKKIYIMVFVFCIVGLNLLQIAKVTNITYWEFIISAITDHYYILYFMIIFYLFSAFKMIEEDNEIILIRGKKYINYFISQIISLFSISTIFTLMHFFIVAIMGYGLNLDNRFIMNAYYYNEVIGVYSTYFKSPILAVVILIVYMILGLTFMGMVLMFINHFFGKRLAIIGMMVMYLLMLISLRTNIDNSLPLLFLNNYIILHHAFAVLGKNFYIIILSEIFLSGFILVIVKNFWHIDITSIKILIRKIGVNKWYLKLLFSRKNIFIMLIFIIISIINIVLRHGILTISDLSILQFYGHGIGYFNLIDFMSLIIYNGIPIYILSSFLEKEGNDRSAFLTIRLKNKKQWFISVIHCGFLLIFIYLLASLCIGVVTGVFLGMKFNGYNYMNNLFLENGLQIIKPYYLYLIILTTKSLELFFYFLVVLICYIYTKGCTLGFLLVNVGYFSYLLTENIAKYTPVGIGSLSRISEFVGYQGIPYLFVMVILILVNTILYLYLRSGVYKRIFN